MSIRTKSKEKLKNVTYIVSRSAFIRKFSWRPRTTEFIGNVQKLPISIKLSVIIEQDLVYKERFFKGRQMGTFCALIQKSRHKLSILWQVSSIFPDDLSVNVTTAIFALKNVDKIFLTHHAVWKSSKWSLLCHWCHVLKNLYSFRTQTIDFMENV